MSGSFEYSGGGGVQPQYDGDIEMLEDAEGANNWQKAGTGADYAAAFLGVASYFGASGLKLITRATTPAANDYVKAFRNLCLPIHDRLVFRGRLCFPVVSVVLSLKVYCYVVTVDGPSLILIRWTPNVGTVEYFNAAGSWVGVASLAMIPVDGQWVDFEAVVDWGSKEFMSLRLAGKVSDMARVAMNADDLGYPKCVSFELYLMAAGAAPATAYVDSLYVGSYDIL